MSLPGLALLALLILGADDDPGPGLHAAGADPSTHSEAREALSDQRYPWYNAKEDRVLPVLPEPDWEGGNLKKSGDRLNGFFQPIGDWFRSWNGVRLPGIGIGAGDLIAIGLAMLLLTVVLVVLLELLRRYRPADQELAAKTAIGHGDARRIEGLPIGDSIDLTDPFAQARRLRERGDYAGAIVYLFAHQLLALNRIGQLRLVPGKTGRQLTRSVPDRELRGRVEPTLRLFEAVYYGRKTPTPEAFEAVWAEAQAFERAALARTEGALA